MVASTGPPFLWTGLHQCNIVKGWNINGRQPIFIQHLLTWWHQSISRSLIDVLNSSYNGKPRCGGISAFILPEAAAVQSWSSSDSPHLHSSLSSPLSCNKQTKQNKKKNKKKKIDRFFVAGCKLKGVPREWTCGHPSAHVLENEDTWILDGHLLKHTHTHSHCQCCVCSAALINSPCPFELNRRCGRLCWALWATCCCVETEETSLGRLALAAGKCFHRPSNQCRHKGEKHTYASNDQMWERKKKGKEKKEKSSVVESGGGVISAADGLFSPEKGDGEEQDFSATSRLRAWPISWWIVLLKQWWQDSVRWWCRLKSTRKVTVTFSKTNTNTLTDEMEKQAGI